MSRIRVSATLAIIALAASARPGNSQPPGTDPARPVVAIMNFTNGSLVDHETYEPFSAGVAGMLLSELRSNPRISLVERERIRQVLDEQSLTRSGQVDAATAAAVGKLLGARHMIFGGFVIDRRGNLRIDARAVNVETSLIEHVETVTDDADNLFRAVERLGRQLSAGLRLSAGGAPEGAGSPTREAKQGQVLANLKYARALQEEDRKNSAKALQLYREFLAESPPDYAPIQRQAAEARIRAIASGGTL